MTCLPSVVPCGVGIELRPCGGLRPVDTFGQKVSDFLVGIELRPCGGIETGSGTRIISAISPTSESS